MNNQVKLHDLAAALATAMLDAEYNRAMAGVAITNEAYQGFVEASVAADEAARRLRNLMIEVAKTEGKASANA